MGFREFMWAWNLNGLAPSDRLVAMWIGDGYTVYPTPAECEPLRLDLAKCAQWANITKADVAESLRRIPDLVWKLDENGELLIHYLPRPCWHFGFGRGGVFPGDDR